MTLCFRKERTASSRSQGGTELWRRGQRGSQCGKGSMCRRGQEREGGTVWWQTDGPGLGGHFPEASVTSSGTQRPGSARRDAGSWLPSRFQTTSPGSSASHLASALPASSSWLSAQSAISALSSESRTWAQGATEPALWGGRGWELPLSFQSFCSTISIY